jgi:hypothetical protein
MANPLPPPGPIGNVLPNRHRTFHSSYADQELDPYQGNYDSILRRFDVDVNPGVTPVVLFEQAVGLGAVPQAYLCCTTSQLEVKVFCVHLPSKFTSGLDGSTTPWDGQGFGFLGEITHNLVTAVNFPSTAFRTIMNTRAKTSDYIATHLDEIGAQGLPANQANELDTTPVNTRQFMYLPARYVPLLLDPAGYTLRRTWEILYPAIIDATDLQACQPLVNWLHVATTGTPVAGNANDIGPSRVAIDLVAPLADSSPLLHRSKILNQALPALFQPSATLEHAITQMAVAVTQQTNETRTAREQKAANAEAPKLPSEKFTITLNILQEYLEVPDE